MEKEFKILIEVPCEECCGVGKVEIHLCELESITGFECPGPGKCGEVSTIVCDGCQGTRFQQERITLVTLKKLLGDL